MSTMGDNYVHTTQCKRTNRNTLFLRFLTIVRRNYDYKSLTFSAHYRTYT